MDALSDLYVCCLHTTRIDFLTMRLMGLDVGKTCLRGLHTTKAQISAFVFGFGIVSYSKLATGEISMF